MDLPELHVILFGLLLLPFYDVKRGKTCLIKVNQFRPWDPVLVKGGSMLIGGIDDRGNVLARRGN